MDERNINGSFNKRFVLVPQNGKDKVTETDNRLTDAGILVDRHFISIKGIVIHGVVGENAFLKSL